MTQLCGSRGFHVLYRFKSHLTLIFLMLVVAVICLPLSSLDQAVAADETLVFSTPEKKQLYRKLTRELRCLKCQNQNLADSPAGIAEDLKREILLMVEDGRSTAHITDFMVSRYGDFILYKPAFKPLTLVLWIAPFLLMGAGLFAIVRLSKTGRQSRESQIPEDSGTTNAQIAGDSAALQQARDLLHAGAVEADASTDSHTSR